MKQFWKRAGSMVVVVAMLLSLIVVPASAGDQSFVKNVAISKDGKITYELGDSAKTTITTSGEVSICYYVVEGNSAEVEFDTTALENGQYGATQKYFSVDEAQDEIDMGAEVDNMIFAYDPEDETSTTYYAWFWADMNDNHGAAAERLVFWYDGDAQEFTTTKPVPKTLESLAIKTQPKLSYKSSEKLDLTDLVVTLTYNTGDEDAAFADFEEKGLTASVANGTTLKVANNGDVITVTHTETGKTADTNALTVGKMTATIQNPTAITNGVYANAAYNLPAVSTIVIQDANGQNVANQYNVSYDHASVTGTTLTHASAETISIAIKATPKDANEYEAPADGALSVTVGNGSAVNPTVSTAASNVPYGDTFEVTIQKDANGGVWTFGTLTNCELVSGTEGTDGKFTFRAKDATGSATVQVNQKGNGGQYLDGTASANITLAKRQLTWDTSKLNATSRAYDGTTTVALTGTLGVGNVYNNETVNVTTTAGGSLTGTAAEANKGTRAVTVTGFGALTGADSGKYQLPAGNPSVNVVITEAKLTSTTLNATKTYNGNANVNLADFGGNVTVNGVNGETLEIATIAGAAYSKADVHTSEAFANKGTITLKAKNGSNPANYDASDLSSVTFQGAITKADQVALTITGKNTISYGEKITLSTTGGSGTGAVTWAVSSGTQSFATLDTATGEVTSVKGGGTLKVKATKDGGANYNDVESAEFTVTVGKKALSITPAALSYALDQSGVDLSGVISISDDLTGLAAAPALSFALTGATGTDAALAADGKTAELYQRRYGYDQCDDGGFGLL